MSELQVLIGLPASGKSTYANQKKDEGYIVLSSDEIRKELLGDVNDQSNHSLVFDVMLDRTKQAIKEGKKVIYDATNISRKRRIHLLKQVKAEKAVAVYFNTPFYRSVIRDGHRDRKVGYDVINKMCHNLQIPIKTEGFNEIKVETYNGLFVSLNRTEKLRSIFLNKLDHDELFSSLCKHIQDFDSIWDLPQDSKYHSFSVSRHTWYVYDYIFENYNNDDQYLMLLVSVFHDLGKARTKSFYSYKGELKRYASFIGHENVSAQLAITNLINMGYSDEFALEVATIVQFHMATLNMSEKTEKKLRNLLSEDVMEKLLFFREADLSAK